MMMSLQRQRGTFLVEFAIVGTLTMVILFAVFEIGRAFFVINALEEATRRGARVAAVCPLNDPAIAEITVFNTPGTGGPSALVPGLATGNVAVQYLNRDSAVLADPAGSFEQISYVRVRINGFQHQLLIPLHIRTMLMPAYETTLPAESLGVPRVGAIVPC